MKTIKTDVCVIGGGSGGLSFAAGAVQMEAKVVLCEGNRKALIQASRIIYYTKQAAKFGIDMRQPYADFARVHEHIQKMIAAIEPHDSVDRFESLGVIVIKSMASFINDKTVQTDECLIKAKYFVLASGSRPPIFAIDGLETTDYLTNETIFDLKEKP